ncbi:MAG TPA: YndJ family transporter [Terriglobales bacterium]|nr:YndJ family transporter [Terriglobales bacterium]
MRNLRTFASTSAALGGIAWVALAAAALLQRAPLGILETLFLLAPLVAVPLGMELLAAVNSRLPAERLAAWLQPLGAACAVATFWFPAGYGAAALAAGWALICGLIALAGLVGLTRGGWKSLDALAFNLARLDLAVAAGWFVASRAGIAPMGFREPIVLLTGLHFHYIGFAGALLAGLTLRRFRVQGGQALWWTVAGLVFVPYLLAAGFVLSSLLKVVAALLLAACGLVFALEWLARAGDFEHRAARALLILASASFVLGMALALAYAVAEYARPGLLEIPMMARFHGIANGVGFVLLGLLGWFAELRWGRRPACSAALERAGEGQGSEGHPIVLYDGLCGFCNAMVRRTLRRDRDGVFRFAPLQGATGQAILSRHGITLPAAGSSDPGTFYLVLDPGAPGERLLARSEAVVFLARRLPGFSLPAALFRWLPRRLRDALYDLVARHRYRFFGRHESCPLPAPEERARFLEG